MKPLAPILTDRMAVVGQTSAKPVCVAFVVGAIAPYTNRQFDALAALDELEVHVLACTEKEPQRGWQTPEPKHYHFEVMAGLQRHRSYTSHIYVNPGVISRLRRLTPDLIILDGFSPTMIAAGLYAMMTGTPYGVMTDGTLETDPGSCSRLHRWMRKLLVPRAGFGLGAGAGSLDLLASYGLETSRCTTLPITPAWDGPANWNAYNERPYDLLFCGALEKNLKGIDHFAEVVLACKSRGHDLNIRIVGDGPDRQWLEDILTVNNIDARFDGHLNADQLAEVYGSSKLFLFPTRADAWGLVVNEALQCGTVVIGSPHAGSTRELVGRFDAGLVLPLEPQMWADAVVRLLATPQKWADLQTNHRKAIDWFSLDHAVQSVQSALVNQIKTPRA